MDATLIQIIQALIKASQELQELTLANEKLKAELDQLHQSKGTKSVAGK